MPYGRRGAEFVVNKKVVDSQYAPSIAGFASGGFIVVWETADPLQDGAGRAIMAQRYDSLGNIVGSEVRVNTSATGEQRAPDVTTLASGGYVITWETSDTTQDGSGTAIKGQLFDSAGAPVGAEFRVNSQLSLNQTVPSVSGLDGGGFVVMWRTNDTTQDGLGGAIKGQIYDASGAAVGGEFLVNAAGFASEIDPAVSGLPGGGFVATWTVNGGNAGDIYAQIFNSSGAKVGNQFLVNTTTALGQDFPAVSQISGGRFVITWDSSVSTSQYDSEIRARIFSADGTPLGNDFVVSTSRVDPGSGVPSDSYQPNVEDLPDGGFFITWTHSSGLAYRSSIRGQIFDASGNRVGSEVLVSTVTDRFEDRGDIAVDGNGMVFAVWGSTHSSGSSGGMDVHGQIFAPSGAPAIVSNGGGDVVSLSIPENQKAVTTVSAVDPEGSALVYSIVGGADASFFAINASTGALSFVTAPNFEHRLDWDNNKTFDVVVSVSDGVMTDIQALTVAITDIDEAPVIGSGPTNYTLAENGTAVDTFYATDPEGKAVTWSIAGGADAARFVIDSTGALRFVNAPNFEVRADVGANNIYNVTIGASDGSVTATRALTVQVTNLNEGPVIISAGGADAASFSVSENTGLITTIVADDPDAQDDYGFAIVGGADAALFTIGVANGVLQFKSGRDFEAPGDSDGNNVYEVIVAVRDFTNIPDTQAISVTVTNANEAPVITSNGGGSAAAIASAENSLAVTNVVASDPDGGALSYAISGGADASRFAIDAATGSLSFLTAPDHEQPADSDGNNVYDVVVSASDGMVSDTQALAITVGNVNERPVIVSNGGGESALVELDEGQRAVTTVVAADPDGSAGVTYSITGGAHADLFVINSTTGALSFVEAPDHEAPLGGSDNVYSVTVTASDGALSSSQSLQVSVRDVNEGIAITSGAAHSVTENSTAVMTATAHDLDGDSPGFAISGGADSALFEIDAETGELRFAAAPNFEAPADSDGDNVYEIEVSASDGEFTDRRLIAVTVGNVDEPIELLSYGGAATVAASMMEGSFATGIVVEARDEDSSVIYSIAGGIDGESFQIDPLTGELSFVQPNAPDFEDPWDFDSDHVHEVVVAATSSTSSATQAFLITITNRNEAPHLYDSSFSVNEGVKEVITFGRYDRDGDVLAYEISGPDSGRFRLDPATGLLEFVDAPDHEAPLSAAGTNVYSVDIEVSDGEFSSRATFEVTVRNVNEGVAITSGGGAETLAVTVGENGTAVTAIAASDMDGDVPTYWITGGPDADRFIIDSVTGVLRFIQAPNFEAPGDVGADNVYDVTVWATDGVLTDSQAISVSVANLNEPVSITSNGGGAGAAVMVAENATAVTIVSANDADGGAVSYAIAGGADAALFTIDPTTGALAFVAGPDFETGGDNVYDVIVSASDGSFTDIQTLAVTVGDVDEPVEIVSYGGAAVVAVNLMEDEFFTGVVVEAVDEENMPVTYSISGGADGHQFEIDPTTGALSFMQPNAADFEDPTDFDSDNVHEVSVTASTSTSSATQTFMISITNRNEAPYVYYESSLTVNEGVQTITALRGYDRDGDSVALAIVGGADAALFELDPATNLLTFKQARNFEAPLSAAGTNVYDVEIEASDGRLTTRETLQITIRNVNEGVAITFGGGGEAAAVTAFENGTTVANIAASDVDGDVLTYSITGGVDGFRFTIDSRTGALRFVNAPNFEAPADVGGNNVYDVVVSVTDGAFTDSQAIAVTVGNVNEPITITSNGGGAGAGITVSENGRAVTTVVAIDVDGAPVHYAIVGGQDAAHFTIDSATGQLAFASLPDFEARSDWGADNVYDVVVSASDGVNTDTQVLAVRVADLNEAVEIVSNAGGASASVTVAENGTAVTNVAAVDPDGRSVTYAIIGGADSARFTIDAATGALAFVAAPNFEAPGDAGADNVYDVVVSASDGTHVDTQALAVTVRNVNEQMAITSNGGGASAALTVTENSAVVTTVVGTDPDGGPVTYAILHGGDSGLFTIDSATGLLSFRAAPNFEAPGDSGGNNVYDVVVMASDGHWSDTQAIAVTVGNADEPLAITSDGGGSTASVSRSENGIAVTVVAASDPEGRAVTYAIAGGADASRFTINAATGALAFIAAPNFEAPGDSGGNNVYDVVVSASDGSFVDTQAVAVTVGNVNEAPVIASNGGAAAGAVSVAENSAAVTVVAATDPDGTIPTYSIVGGADAARFTINAQTGALQFVVAPDWELPGDSDQDNVYSVIVRSSDGQLVDDQALNVTVTNIRDGNTVNGTSGGDSISASSAIIAMRTSNEEDIVFGRDGHDTIYGMAGDDELSGDAGNDVLVGGTGADRLTGGLGKDQFTYNNVSESTGALRDLIMDFSRSQGDKISLSGIDANSLVSTNQAFTFIGTSAFSNVAGQLRYETSAGVTTIFGDVNGDGLADLQIQLSGSIPLVASDFVL
jgi:hypothetical protein